MATNSTSLTALRGEHTQQQVAGNMLPIAAGETAAAMVATQARAMVSARFELALMRPRDWDDVRARLLHACKRPNFANNKSTYYIKPIGDGVEGLGIRFVEEAFRCMHNVLIETTTIYDDSEKEIVRVTVTDLESNLTYPGDVRISKTVERSKPMDDGTYIAVRKNSYGKPVYTIPATDDELLNKRLALISKAIRSIGLRVIPGDIQDEAESTIKATRLEKAAKDPDAERKSISDAFAEFNVSPADLAEYLGHELAKCTPPELVELRGYYSAIKEGETTWSSVLGAKSERESRQREAADNAKAKADAKNARSANKTPAGEPKTAPTETKTPAGDTGTPKTETSNAPPKANSDEPVQPKPQAAAVAPSAPHPTVGDALRAVNAGDDDIARDIARQLGPDSAKRVEDEIAKRDQSQGSFE